MLAATRPHSWLDRSSAIASLFGASMPVFWLGIVLMVIFSLHLGWLPASGMWAPYGGGDARDLLAHLVLPALTLAAASVTIIARLTRSTMLEVLGQDYIRTARAKGLVERLVVARHGLRNALIPIVTVVGVQAGYLLGGAVLTETVFAWPGVGTLMIQGILARIFPLVHGCVRVIAVSFVLIPSASILYGGSIPDRYDAAPAYRAVAGALVRRWPSRRRAGAAPAAAVSDAWTRNGCGQRGRRPRARHADSGATGSLRVGRAGVASAARHRASRFLWATVPRRLY